MIGKKKLCARVGFGLVAIYFLSCQQLHAEQEQQISLQLSFDSLNSESIDRLTETELEAGVLSDKQCLAAALVFVNGQMAGIASGIIDVPIGDGPAVVEIGPPALRQQPLYSFEIGAKDLKKKKKNVDVVNSKISFKSFVFEGDTVDGLKIGDNEIAEMELTNLGERGWVIFLPSGPMEQISQYAEKTGPIIKLSEQILTKYASRGEAKTPAHFSYDQEKGQSIRTQYSPSSSWIGATFYLTTEAPATKPEQKSTGWWDERWKEFKKWITRPQWRNWRIASLPDNARIILNGCRKNSLTTSDMLVPDVTMKTLLLQLPGYEYCSYIEGEVQMFDGENPERVFFCKMDSH